MQNFIYHNRKLNGIDYYTTLYFTPTPLNSKITANIIETGWNTMVAQFDI